MDGVLILNLLRDATGHTPLGRIPCQEVTSPRLHLRSD